MVRTKLVATLGANHSSGNEGAVMPAGAYLIAGIVGACAGSFLNVVIHRLPAGRSVVRPGSCCPCCGEPIAWPHKMPVLSYVWLRGRCAACRRPIPPSYLLVEAVTALVFGGLLVTAAGSAEWVRDAVLAALLIAAAEIDRRHGVIPNRLAGVGALLGLALGLWAGIGLAANSLLASLATGGLLLLIREGSRLATGRVGLGMGDVKLAAVMGLYLGWDSLWVFCLAVLVGGLLGLAGLLMGRLTRTSHLPFAPFLAVAAALHWFVLPPEVLEGLLW